MWRRSWPAHHGRASRPSVAEALEGARATLPVLVDLDEELEVGAGLQLRPNGPADRLENRATPADYDPLLRLSLDEDLAADARPLPLGDLAGDGVGQLLASVNKELLAHELGHPHGLGDVGRNIGWVVGRSLGHARHDARH